MELDLDLEDSYCGTFLVSRAVARRHRALRETLQDCGGLTTDLERLIEGMRRRGVETSLQQIEADLRFFQTCARSD